MSKKTEIIAFRLEKEIKIKLEELAEKEERSISWIINKAVIEYLEKKTSKNQ